MRIIKEVHIEKTIQDRQELTITPLTSLKELMKTTIALLDGQIPLLAYSGYVFIHPNDKSELFKPRSSWFPQKM